MEEQKQQSAQAVQDTHKQQTVPETGEYHRSGPPRRTPGWYISMSILILMILVVCAWFFLFRVNQFYLSLALEGEAETVLEYGQPYEEAGAIPMLYGSHVLKEGYILPDTPVEINSDLQEDTLGLYSVTYCAEFFGWHAETQRSIRVVDWECPVITLVEGNGDTLLPGTEYTEDGFTATDNYDGDLTDRVHRTVEGDLVTYVVMDSSGNPAYAERWIPYYDPDHPSLELNDGEAISIDCGTIFSDPGYKAFDTLDGDLTDQVVVEGEVLWYKPGTYELTYSVTDSFGNSASAKRTVEVIGQTIPETKMPDGKVIYLTFDDGPGPDTDRLLRVLDKYGVKATFFVVDSGYYAVLDRIVERGHSIGIHSSSHNYEEIYSSPEAYFTDLYKVQDMIYEYTGVKTRLLRFPGGGSNEISLFNKGIMSTLTQAVQDSGFKYFDWNVDSNDAAGATKADTVFGNVITAVQGQQVSLVLQHDTHGYSVEAVERIIIWAQENGYKFLPLDMTSPDFHHTVMN